MLKIFVSTTVLMGCQEVQEVTSDVNLYGGRQGTEADTKYVVRVDAKKGGRGIICTGVILDSQTILTAAHCLAGIDVGSAKVWLGVSGRTEAPRVEKSVIHRSYTTENFAFDIGIIGLSQPLESFYTGVPIVAANSTPPIGKLLTAAGYGLTLSQGGGSLRVGEIKLIDTVPEINYLESEFTNGTGICRGDSGGPLTYNGELVGMSLEVESEACLDRAYFLDLRKYRGWIQCAKMAIEGNANRRCLSQVMFIR